MGKEIQETAIITTYTGTHVDLLRPDVAEIHLDDIAAHLSRTPRFGGATQRTYTVAEHLLLGLEFCVPWHRFKWFTHDFSEAYLGDVVGPFKRTWSMQVYRALELEWEIALTARFGIPKAGVGEVRTLDARMLVTEQRDLMGRHPRSTDKYKPFALHIAPVAPSTDWLQEHFLAAFYDLVSKTEGASHRS